MAHKEYRDDILDLSANIRRKYTMINNPDGTVSFIDVTEYLQEGSKFGADEINELMNGGGGSANAVKNEFWLVPSESTSQVVVNSSTNTRLILQDNGTILLESNALLPIDDKTVKGDGEFPIYKSFFFNTFNKICKHYTDGIFKKDNEIKFSCIPYKYSQDATPRLWATIKMYNDGVAGSGTVDEPTLLGSYTDYGDGVTFTVPYGVATIDVFICYTTGLGKLEAINLHPQFELLSEDVFSPYLENPSVMRERTNSLISDYNYYKKSGFLSYNLFNSTLVRAEISQGTVCTYLGNGEFNINTVQGTMTPATFTLYDGELSEVIPRQYYKLLLFKDIQDGVKLIYTDYDKDDNVLQTINCYTDKVFGVHPSKKRVTIVLEVSASVQNLTVKPMLVDNKAFPNVTLDDFLPYAPTNREMLSWIQDLIIKKKYSRKYTITANGSTHFDITTDNVAIDGYKLIGIVGFSTGNAYTYAHSVVAETGDYSVSLKNTGSSAVDTTFTCYLLYLKILS